MKRHKVELRPRAKADLNELALYIARHATPSVALAYTRRIREFCSRLQYFPERGRRRDDVRPGLRTMGFEGRVSIVFEVSDGAVGIVRILYGGRDLEALLGDENPDAG
jgi:toxin ParE1/3/4